MVSKAQQFFDKKDMKFVSNINQPIQAFDKNTQAGQKARDGLQNAFAKLVGVDPKQISLQLGAAGNTINVEFKTTGKLQKSHEQIQAVISKPGWHLKTR